VWNAEEDGSTLRSLVQVTLLFGLLAAACTPSEPRAFDGAAALRDVVTQVEFGPRVPGTAAHRKCADWIASELEKSHAVVRKQKFSWVPPPPRDTLATWEPDTLPMWNIIAAFNPKARDRITFCAHWDSRPMADEEPDSSLHDQPIPGANDGASGVAVLLELARIMGETPPPFGVDLIFFDAEDLGRSDDISGFLIGSKWFVRQAVNYRPMAVVLIDMVGDSDLTLPRERFSDSLSAGLTDLVWQTAARLNLEAFVDSVGEAVIDDHIPFLIAGIPAVDIIDFDYPYWHTLEDTPDKVSAASLATVGTLLSALVYQTPAERYRGLRMQRPSPNR